MAETINVEVVYATREKQRLISLQVSVGTTAIETIEQSGISSAFPAMEVDGKALGVFSRKVGLDYVMQANDRLEIYRPLVADPKEIRRQREKQQRQ